MKKILILGGSGQTGRALSPHLLETNQVSLTLAARRLDNVKAFADDLKKQFPQHTINAVHADASNAGSLRDAFRGQDLVLVASPTTANAENVVHAALDCGTDYLDVQLSAAKFALLQSLAEEIKKSGRCFITEAGFHPGLPAALVRYAVARMDHIETAAIIGYLNLGRNFPYTEAVDELVEVFKNYQAQVYRDGAWTKSGAFDTRKFDLGSDIGMKMCYSMFFEELRLLPQMFPALRELGFYISESHWINDWIITPFAMAWLKLMPHAVRSIGRLIWWSMTTFHKPPYRVEIQVQAAGLKNGKRITLRASVSHSDGYELTAIPVVAALQQYLDGTARKPGLWMMGHLVDPDRLMTDMQKLGARVSTEVLPNQ